MKKQVCLVQRHCEEDTVLLSYEGEAQVEIDDRKWSIFIQNIQPAYELNLHVYEDAMILDHLSQQHTRLSFRKGHQTNAHVENEMGKICLNMRTYQYEKTKNSVFVHYAIMDGDQVCDTFELTIKMGGGMK